MASLHTCVRRQGVTVSKSKRAQVMSVGLGDLAEEVTKQLATSLAADDTRRPWLRTATLIDLSDQVLLGIQHHEGRATWVLRHSKQHEIRFAASDGEHCAVNLYLKTVTQGKSGADVKLVHHDKVLMSTYVKDHGPSKDYTEDHGAVMQMIDVIKKAL